MAKLRKSPAIVKMRARLTRTGAESTFETYLPRVKRFLEWAGMTPDELIAAVEAGEFEAPERLNDFFDGRSDAPKTQKGYADAVKSLLRINLSKAAKMGIDWDDLALQKMRTVEVDKAPTRDVIKGALDESRGIQDRMVPLVALSSGMRIGSIAKLTVGEVDLETFPDVAVVRVKPDIAKGFVGYVTFLTPEAKSAVISSLDQRRRGGEELGESSPLVASPRGGFYSDPGSVSTRWGEMLDRAGLGEKGGRHRIYHFHTLRKFFRTALERVGVSKSFRERLLGHSGEYLDASYFDPAFSELLAAYRSGVKELTVYAVEGVSREDAALEAMRAIAITHGLDPLKVRVGREDLGAVEEIGLLRSAIEGAQRETAQRPAITLIRGREDGGTEQLVIEQEDLQEYMDNGWLFKATLNNGSTKVVVERPQP